MLPLSRRDSVHHLPSSTMTTNDFANGLRALGAELAAQPCVAVSTQFSLVVEGAPRESRPFLRDQVYLIAREAVHNAFRRAEANRIEAEILYGKRLLRVRVRDDGRGIDPAIWDAGLASVYGLLGMQERAARIGGRLNIWTALGAGTEIEVTVPGSIAYTAPPARRSFRLLKKR